MALNMQTSVYKKHCNCEVYVDLAPKSKRNKPVTIHAGALRCRTHNKWLKWLSKQEVRQLTQIVEVSQ